MPVPDLGICNEALAECPQDPIVSLGEQSLAARECARVYSQVLGEVLSSSDWECVRVRMMLAAITNDRPNEWGSAYALPNDCVNPQRLAPDYAYFSNDDLWPTTFDGITPVAVAPAFLCIGRYEIASGKVYTWEQTAILEYTSANPATFTPKLRRAIVLMLAARVVLPITKSVQRQQSLIALAAAALQDAMADNFNRQPRRYWQDYRSTAQTAREGW